MSFLRLEAKAFFVFAMRWFFGLWLLYVGLVKWITIGPMPFTGMIATQFDKTWSPHALNIVLAWVIIVAEPVLASLVLWGRKPRLVWTLVAVLMFMLAMGQTILMKPDVIVNWQYTVLALACAALSEPDKSA